MILDALLQFDAAANLAQVVGTYNSANIVDLGGPAIPALANGQGARDMGIGDDPALKLLVQVITAFTSGGAGTLVVGLAGATDNGAGAPAAFSTYWQSGAIALASLKLGARLFDMDLPRPPQGVAMPRFLRMFYTVGGATMTAGQVESLIVLDRDDQIYNATDNSIQGGYPPGIAVIN